MIRTYSDLIKLQTFEERFEYLKLLPNEDYHALRKFRYLNQKFYTSNEWKSIRNKARVRDKGFDLGVKGLDIVGRIYIHHMNPVTLEDLENQSPKLLDMNNLISCSYETHEAITYSDEKLLPKPFIERKPGDTKLW